MKYLIFLSLALAVFTVQGKVDPNCEFRTEDTIAVVTTHKDVLAQVNARTEKEKKKRRSGPRQGTGQN